MNIKATTIIGNGFPTKEGRRLADYLLSKGEVSDDLTIDLRDCQSALLISAFFNSFLQTVFESDSQLLKPARNITWLLEFEFQKQNVARWVSKFEPRAEATQ